MLDKFAKKESPILGYAGFGGGVSTLLTLASGKATYIEDVFSTYLYDGNSTARSINNGIDLAGEGGLVWTKSRTSSHRNCFLDTERGVHNVLFSDVNVGTDTDNTTITSFNDNGYTMGTSAYKLNVNNESMCSWTFRKCPGFFDIVTYTGNGTAGRQIAHNLGSVPGMIIIKSLTSTENWTVWHRSLTSNQYLIQLNLQSEEIQGGNGPWNNTAPTSSVFTLGGDFNVNQNNQNYVAYIFAHNDGSFGEASNEAVIKCDSYTGTQSEDTEINVGFEPQWILIKNASSNSTDWVVVDTMRGLPVGSDSEVLKANAASTPSSYRAAALTATGFKLGQAVASVNGSGDTYIYMAIRRPHKPPTAATEVFNTTYATGFPRHAAGFAPDSVFQLQTDGGSGVYNRVLGAEALRTNNTNGTFGSSWTWDRHMTGSGPNYTSNTVFAWSFKRAAGFFDVVTYTGTGSTLNVKHNLGVTPEFIWVKRHDGNSQWATVHNYDLSKGQNIDTDAARYSLGFNIYGTPTSTTITPHPSSGMNSSGEKYIGFLFASLPGISKVGSYSGTGNDIDVDCGFSSGARFVLVKRVDSSGNWYCWDTLRGIASGNDTYSLWDTAAAQTTNTDYIDPLNAGFTITSSAPAALNTNGGTYIFLAIA